MECLIRRKDTFLNILHTIIFSSRSAGKATLSRIDNNFLLFWQKNVDNIGYTWTEYCDLF